MTLRLLILSFFLLLNTACEGGGGSAAGGGGADQSSVKTLSSLTLSSGTLSPAFASGTLSYTASVAHSASSITLTPVKSSATASIQARVNSGSYSAVSSGFPSSARALNVGANTVEVRVTAADSSTQTYSVVVTRAPSSVATLSALTHNNSAVYTPVFASGTFSYSMTVLNATTSITVTPTVTAASNATLQVRVNAGSYAAVTSATASGPLALNVGVNTIEVRVTAQDTTTTQIYTLNVTRTDTPRKIFIANENASIINNGNLGGISGADAICNSALNKPAGTYKAMISDGNSSLGGRVACTTANCSVGGVAENFYWALSPDTEYENADSELIGITNASAIFTFPITNQIAVVAGGAAWTGLNADFTSSANNCSGFTSNAGFGTLGTSTNTNDTILFFSTISCNTDAYLYCVEQ